MTRTTYRLPQRPLIASLLIALVAVVVPGARAAFTNDFDELRTELQARSIALTGSLVKIEQKRKKAVDKVIVAIDKPAITLAADVKTAGKVAKSLARTFPGEFAAALVGTNDLSTLVDGAFAGLESDVTAQFTSLQSTVSALLDGSSKTKALASVVKAQTALDAADAALDYARKSKSLGKALKAIASGLKAANSGSGGGGCSSSSVTMTVSNEGPVWHSTSAVASYTPSTGDFTVGGTRGAAPDPFDTLAIGLTGVTVSGDYVLGETSIGGTTDYFAQALTVNAVSYALVGGTIHIATFHAGSLGTPTGSVTGQFSFTAESTDGGVITLAGTFNICNMVTLP